MSPRPRQPDPGEGAGGGARAGLGRLCVGLGMGLAILLLAGWPGPAPAQQAAPAPEAPAAATARGGGEPQADVTKPEEAGAKARSGGLSLGQAAGLPTIGKTKAETSGLDYPAWERMAERAEAVLASGDAATDEALVRLRGQLADWREVLLGAESTNAARIETLREQIDALGPAPATGEAEVAEIANRRVELTDQLVRLQAPGLAAEEAYRRADGLIAEIDRVLRERQANALLKLWPSPLNPANWSEGLRALGHPFLEIWDESRSHAADPRVQRGFVNALPLVLAYLILAVALIWRGRSMLSRLLRLVHGPVAGRAHRIWDFLTSLAVALVPVLGLSLLSLALKETGLLGPVGQTVLGGLGRLGFVVVIAFWLGARAFVGGGAAEGTPAAEGPTGGLPLRLAPEAWAQARFVTGAFGLVLVASRLRRATLDQMELGDVVLSVTNFPILLAGGFLLWRLGRLLASHRPDIDTGGGDEPRVNYRDRSIGILARLVSGVGIVGPVLAAVGYVSAAQGLIFPAALSLALLALLILAQRLVADIGGLLSRSEADQEGLAPVLIGFALTLATLPLFALIWGARTSDLTELWTRFQEGFQLGQARISPTDFLIFAVIFGMGFIATRLLQGALKSSVLPRTKLDQGGQNAIVSGLGYLGIFLSALVAIDSTGIDLSGLAIVAGALSVGIGFGLQTIVSNFVSGVILLIERPVSEGDWIEVGPVQGIVKSISVRSTRIQTFDRSDVIVPNSDLITGRVTNWTRFNLTGRLTVPVAVALPADSRQVEAMLRQIAEAQPLVLLNPPPVVALMGFGAEVMNFELRVILRDVNFQIEVKSEINQAIAQRFAAEGLAFSGAHRDHLAKLAEGPDAEAAALAEQRAEDQLFAELMGPEAAERIRAAREVGT